MFNINQDISKIKELMDIFLDQCDNQEKDDKYSTDFENSKGVLDSFLIFLIEQTTEYKELIAKKNEALFQFDKQIRKIRDIVEGE